MGVNNVVILGRLTRDVEIGYIGDNVKKARFTLAVERPYKRKGADKPDVDFIKIDADRSKADFAEKYFSKGKQVSVVGSIETYKYEKDGNTIYDFCIKAEKLGFADSISISSEREKSFENGNAKKKTEVTNDFGFESFDDLPFNTRN